MTPTPTTRAPGDNIGANPHTRLINSDEAQFALTIIHSLHTLETANPLPMAASIPSINTTAHLILHKYMLQILGEESKKQ